MPFATFSSRVPTVGLSIGNHDNNQQGPDENLRLQNLGRHQDAGVRDDHDQVGESSGGDAAGSGPCFRIIGAEAAG
jgi:hypothetical protein